jgi:hypothetical protein
MSEIHEGGCVCGAVRYRTKAAPQRVSLCSCSWCCKRTGSALGLSVYFDKDDVEFLQGERKSYRLTSDAGRWIESEFCPNCGGTVSWTLEFLPGFRGIAGGSFDQPSFWYRPQRYVFARSKPDWLAIPEGCEVFQAMAT